MHICITCTCRVDVPVMSHQNNISKPKHPALLKFCTHKVLGFIPNLLSWQPKKIEKMCFFKLEKVYIMSHCTI